MPCASLRSSVGDQVIDELNSAEFELSEFVVALGVRGSAATSSDRVLGRALDVGHWGDARSHPAREMQT